jgi:hypothetical protein
MRRPVVRPICSHPLFREHKPPNPLARACGWPDGHWWNGRDLSAEGDESASGVWVEARRYAYLEGLRDEAVLRPVPIQVTWFPVEEIADVLTGFYRNPAYIRIPVWVAFHLIRAVRHPRPSQLAGH